MMTTGRKELLWRSVKAHAYGAVVIGVFLVILPLAAMTVIGLQPLALPPATVGTVFWIGVLLMIGGGTLSYSCMILFVSRGDGTAFPDDPPKRLVALGPYRFVRNPMYIGNLLLALGVGTVLASATYLVYTLFLAIATHFYISKIEEPALLARYGESYQDYCASTSRWIPRVRSQKRTQGA